MVARRNRFTICVVPNVLPLSDKNVRRTTSSGGRVGPGCGWGGGDTTTAGAGGGIGATFMSVKTGKVIQLDGTTKAMAEGRGRDEKAKIVSDLWAKIAKPMFQPDTGRVVRIADEQHPDYPEFAVAQFDLNQT